MEYYGWLDGDVCAYRDADLFRVFVADGGFAGVRDSYVETSASALLG